MARLGTAGAGEEKLCHGHPRQITVRHKLINRINQ